MLNKKFVILTEKMPLFKNVSKSIILTIIGSYLMDKYSVFKEIGKRDAETDEKNKKSKLYESELFNVFFEEIEQISNHFDSLSMITFDS